VTVYTGQAHETPQHKLASSITNILFTQSSKKVRAALQRDRITVFPLQTVVNATCNIKILPLDGTTLQQLKEIETN